MTRTCPPARPSPTAGRLGPPDLVLETPAYTLSSQDRDVFRNFVVPIQLASPRWVQSIELRPVNPRVTHHARLGVDSSNESIRRDADDDQPGYPGMAWGQDPDGQLVIWAPGMVATPATPGVAWRLYPKTTPGVAHAHAAVRQAGGRPVPRRHPLRRRAAASNIRRCCGSAPATSTSRPGAASRRRRPTSSCRSTWTCTRSFRTPIRSAGNCTSSPSGPTARQEPLISIDQFDENWHDCYRYRRPVRLPRGTRLVSTFVYDNSDDNLRNRNHPARRVVYGSNANDEMADVYLQVTAVHPDQRAVLMEDYKSYDLRSQVDRLSRNRSNSIPTTRGPWKRWRRLTSAWATSAGRRRSWRSG